MRHHLLELRAGPFPFLAVQRCLVPQVEDDEQRRRGGEPLRPQPQRPRERHPVQVSEQQRRVADGSQQPTAVRDEEDEEDHDVRLPPPALVGAQQRPDQQHRGPRRPQEIGEDGAQAEHAGIHERRARERPPDVDAPGDHEQRGDDDDERGVLTEFFAEHRPAGRAERGAELPEDRERQQPCDDRLVAVGVPPRRCDERRHGDRGEQRHERQGAHERELGSEHGR